MWHLLTHTSGLTYGFHYARAARRRLPRPRLRVRRAPGHGPRRPARTPGRACRCSSSPGTEFNYSVSTDVLGRVVEVLSGQPLDVFFDGAHLRPAGHDGHRRSATPTPSAAPRSTHPGLVRNDRMGSAAFGTPRFLSGGGGLVSTADRLPPLHEHAAGADGTRLLGTPYAALHGPQPPPGRRRAQGGRAADDLRDPERRHGLRARLLGRARPAAHEDALQRGRAGLGRPRQHDVLGRPEGAHHRAVLHPARPVEHLPAAHAAAPARSTGAGDERPSSSASSARTRASAPS